MIEAIKNIGEIILKEDETRLLDNLVLDLQTQIKGKKQYLVMLNYKTSSGSLEIDFEDIKENTSQKYLWVGNADAANSPQIYSTTNKLDYLFSQTLPNLYEKVSKKSNLEKTLAKVLNVMFYDLGIQGRNRFLIDGEKCGFLEKGTMQKFRTQLTTVEKENTKKSEMIKNIIKDVGSKLETFINLKTKLSKKEIGLYTLKIDGKLITEDEEYQRVVIREKIGSLFGKKKKICSSCNKYKYITETPPKPKTVLGYYITDKIGFSSNLSGEFTKNFVLCEDCYKKILLGGVFIRNKFQSVMSGLNLYIIPKFLFPIEINLKQLDKWAEYIQFTFNSAKSFKGLKDFEFALQTYKEYEENNNNFIINLLFYRRRQAEFKVLKLIKDVPPTRLYKLIRITNEIKDIADRMLGNSNQWIIDLQNIYYLIPLRKTQNEIEYRKILELYDAIFSGKPISYHFLMNQFVELAQVYRFEKFDIYNIRKQEQDIGLIHAMLKANFLLLYLRRVKLLRGGVSMDYNNLQVKSEIKTFLKEMGYDEPKVALFLLGYLIGEIGNAQYIKGSSKPVLNKITYQGMNKGKLLRLLNEVFGKLIEYKRLYSNEQVFAECKRLIDMHINTWLLSDQENVFYVLSGYAYATHKAIIAASQREEKKEVKTNG